MEAMGRGNRFIGRQLQRLRFFLRTRIHQKLKSIHVGSLSSPKHLSSNQFIGFYYTTQFLCFVVLIPQNILFSSAPTRRHFLTDPFLHGIE
jgi:hypothetical protein